MTTTAPAPSPRGGDGVEDVRPGAFAEYMKTIESSVLHKPRPISWDAAALTEPLSGAWKDMIQYSQVQVADDVVVIGVGPIGLLMLLLLKARKVEPVVIAGGRPGRLAVAGNRHLLQSIMPM